MSGYLRDVRAGLRRAAVTWLVASVAFLAAWTFAPVLLGPAVHVRAPAAVDRLYADHDCARTAAAGRTMLLISTPAGGPQLIPVPTTQDQHAAQTDWLYDQRADWYGWCRP